MKIQIDDNLYLSIDNNSYGLLTTKFHQADALNTFKCANQSDFSKLTNREKEILILLAEGNSNVDVASHLNISRRTVENHRKSINRKLQIQHYREIVIFALAYGLTSFKPK